MTNLCAISRVALPFLQTHLYSGKLYIHTHAYMHTHTNTHSHMYTHRLSSVPHTQPCAWRSVSMLTGIPSHIPPFNCPNMIVWHLVLCRCPTAIPSSPVCWKIHWGAAQRHWCLRVFRLPTWTTNRRLTHSGNEENFLLGLSFWSYLSGVIEVAIAGENFGGGIALLSQVVRQP